MANDREFINWLIEQCGSLGSVRARGMFGGHGLYLDDLFFGLVADDALYLKVDDLNRPRFEAAGAEPFRYPMKDGRMMELSYYAPPEGALEDPDELADWGRGAIDAALRARAGKPKKKPGPVRKVARKG